MPEERNVEHEWLLEIANGNEQAFAALFRRYTPKLMPFLVKLTRNEHVAREMYQETFLRLWMNRVELAQVAQPAAWIYRIASNVSLTYLRTQSNRQRLLRKIEPVEAVDSTSLSLDSKELRLIIRNAVDSLPEKRREVYRLSREEGLSHQQIADRLNISVNTVKVQIGLSLRFIQGVIQRQAGLSILTVLFLFSR